MTDQDRILGWKSIEEFTRMERRAIIKYARQYQMPLMRTPSNRPVLYKSLFKEWEIAANMKKEPEACIKTQPASPEVTGATI